VAAQPVAQVGVTRTPGWWLAKLLFFIAALCEVFAAITVASSTVIITHTWQAWLAGGLAAAFLALAVPLP
jgi:hypothetical protein